MHRFLVQREQIDGDGFVIVDPQVITHARKILRLKAGDEVELFDGEGGVYTANIGLITKQQMVGDILEYTQAEFSGLRLTLAQSLPKGSKLDDILRMNTEVGVYEFILFESEYSVVKTQYINANKLTRYQRIVEEASRQSERTFVPDIIISEKSDVLQLDSFDKKIILTARDGESTESIMKFKHSLKETDKVLVVIGPEGGFSPDETIKFIEAGFIRIHLNLPILRTQTAGIVVSGILLA